MFNAFASLFGYLMNFIYNIVQNYGIAIILFTIFVKLLLLPLTMKQQKSLDKAQEMQPLVQELQRKYGKDQQKFAEEYQKLLKEKNTTMMSSMGCSGCLINLIQLPILLGMFYMMANPLTHIVKMNKDEINGYKEQLNEMRMTQAIEQINNSGDEYSGDELEKMIENAEKATYVSRYYELELIKEKDLLGIDIKFDMNFLGINLCDIAATNRENKVLIIIPILSTLFTYLSLYISTAVNKKKGIKQPKPEDMDFPVPDTRLMNIMMPLMMGYIAYSVPQGVGLYWTTSNMIGVIQLVCMKIIFSKKENVGENDKKQKDTYIKADYEVVSEEKNPISSNEKENSLVVKNPGNSNNKKKNNNKSKKKKKK